MSKKKLIKKYEDILNKPFSEFTKNDEKQFKKFLSELDNTEERRRKMKYYTLETWLEDNKDVCLDDVILLDYNSEEIDIDKYDLSKQRIIMETEIISHDKERDEYFITHVLTLDISKGELDAR